MGDTITLDAKVRDLNGPKPNVLRANGSTPAVIHDHGKDSHHIVVDEAELKKVYSKAGKHAPVELQVDGKKFTTIIKEVTHKPATSVVYHTVFQAVKANEKVTAQIPLKLTDDIPAEKASLLVVNGTTTVDVEALPKDLVDVIEVNAGVLVEAGDKIVVGDVKAPDGILITTDPETLVAAVEVPKDQIAEADAAAAELADQTAGKPSDEAETEAEEEE